VDNNETGKLIVPSTSNALIERGSDYGTINENAEETVKRLTLDELRVFQFKNCTVLANCEQGIARTIFRDGSYLDALALNPQTARFIGYDMHEDITMCALRAAAEHDILHTLIMERMGHQLSPNHFSIVHEDDPTAIPIAARDDEEIIVIGVQAFMNDAPDKLWVNFEKIIMRSFIKDAATRLMVYGINIEDLKSYLLNTLR
jgi:hypothetical protein